MLFEIILIVDDDDENDTNESSARLGVIKKTSKQIMRASSCSVPLKSVSGVVR